MEIIELQDKDREVWDEFVEAAEHSSVFHLSGWKKVMEETYGLRTHFLCAKEGDCVVGVLPLLQVRSRLSGYFFTSLPGGICALDESAAQALLDHTVKMVKNGKARYLILRDSYRKWDLPELVTSEDHCTFMIKISCDANQMWKRIDRRVRQHTRHAIESDLQVVIGPDYLEKFYGTYSLFMREMGTPTLGPQFFQNIWKEFPRNFANIMVFRGQQVLGGIIAAFFKDTIYNIWWGMLPEFYKLRSCHILYWELLKHGCENGYQWMDLGRSEVNSGTYTFKTRWPVESRPLFMQFFLNGINRPPAVGNQRAKELQYRLFVTIWKRLPAPLVEAIGPQLRKWMPFG
jgi:FemAB-related protein (PEP-CTERM system-associated)